MIAPSAAMRRVNACWWSSTCSPAALRRGHDDRALAHRRGQHDRARPAVADDDGGLAHHRLHLLVSQVLPVIGVHRRRGGAGLDEAAGDPLAALGEPRVDPSAQPVERVEVRPHRHEDEGEVRVQKSPPMTRAPG